MFFLFSFSLTKTHAIINDYSLLGKAIYLDAGHGGIDAGAISNHIVEKDMNLVITYELASKLIAKGAYVYLTRDGDYDLSTTTYNRKRSDLYNRAKLINESKCDMFISIHLNSTTSSSWRGLQIFYNSKLEENEKIAKVISDTLTDKLNNVRDIKKENTYYMYKFLKVPGILIEAGFISNANDNYLLRQKDYRNKLTDAIALGIENYFSN